MSMGKPLPPGPLTRVARQKATEAEATVTCWPGPSLARKCWRGDGIRMKQSRSACAPGRLRCTLAGQAKGLEGLAMAIFQLWQRTEIVKVAIKPRVQNLTNLNVAEELKVRPPAPSPFPPATPQRPAPRALPITSPWQATPTPTQCVGVWQHQALSTQRPQHRLQPQRPGLLLAAEPVCCSPGEAGRLHCCFPSLAGASSRSA